MPILKLSMNRTVFFSKGTVVPPDVTRTMRDVLTWVSQNALILLVKTSKSLGLGISEKNSSIITKGLFALSEGHKFKNHKSI